MIASVRNRKMKELRAKIKRGRVKFGSALRQARALGIEIIAASKRGRRRARS